MEHGDEQSNVIKGDDKMSETREMAIKIKEQNKMDTCAKLLLKYKKRSKSWECHVASLMHEKSKTINDIVNECAIDIKTAKKWIKEPPLQREKVIYIGLALHLSKQEINTLLDRYARFPKLNSKNPDDVIFIFLLKPENRSNDTLHAQFADFKDIYHDEVWHAACFKFIDEIYGNLQNWAHHKGIDVAGAEEIVRNWKRSPHDVVNASIFMQLDSKQIKSLLKYTYLNKEKCDKILADKNFINMLDSNSYYTKKTLKNIHMNNKDDASETGILHIELDKITLNPTNKVSNFKKYVRNNINNFLARYHKLHKYVKIFCDKNMPSIELEDVVANKKTRNELRKTLSIIRSPLSRIRMDGSNDLYAVPNRDKFIALGLYLDMTYSQINKLLTLAGMEELYPKHLIEGAIIFVLKDLEDHYPSAFYESSMDSLDAEEIDSTTELAQYFGKRLAVQKKGKRYMQLINELIMLTGLRASEIETKLDNNDLTWVETQFKEKKQSFNKSRYTELYFMPSIPEYVARRITRSCLREAFEDSTISKLLQGDA